MRGRALVVTVCLLATWGYLAKASRAEPTQIRESFEGLPYQIGPWAGTREPALDAKTLGVLRVDDYALRFYRRSAAPGVGLYIGYYASQRQGDTMHSPLNCLPGAGWIPIEQSHVTIPIDGRTQGPIEVNRVVIQKGIDRQLVLYWYQSHGRVIASEYWGKIYTVVDAIRMNRTDAAMVRVIVRIRGEGPAAADVAEREAVAFTQALFPLLGRHLPS